MPPPPWKGHSVERWQEYPTTLQALYTANIDFMTQAQSLQKMCQVFRDAGELAAADSLTYYLVAFGQDPPPPHFETVLRDIDSLFKVNRVYNALDIVNEIDFKFGGGESIKDTGRSKVFTCINI